MSFLIKCPVCNAELECSEEYIGQEVQCTQCGQVITLAKEAAESENAGEDIAVDSVAADVSLPPEENMVVPETPRPENPVITYKINAKLKRTVDIDIINNNLQRVKKSKESITLENAGKNIYFSLKIKDIFYSYEDNHEFVFIFSMGQELNYVQAAELLACFIVRFCEKGMLKSITLKQGNHLLAKKSWEEEKKVESYNSEGQVTATELKKMGHEQQQRVVQVSFDVMKGRINTLVSIYVFVCMIGIFAGIVLLAAEVSGVLAAPVIISSIVSIIFVGTIAWIIFGIMNYIHTVNRISIEQRGKNMAPPRS